MPGSRGHRRGPVRTMVDSARRKGVGLAGDGGTEARPDAAQPCHGRRGDRSERRREDRGAEDEAHEGSSADTRGARSHRDRAPGAVENLRGARGLLPAQVVGAGRREAGRPRHRGTDAQGRREGRGGPRPVRVGVSEDGGVRAHCRPAAARDPVGGRAPAPVPAAPRHDRPTARGSCLLRGAPRTCSPTRLPSRVGAGLQCRGDRGRPSRVAPAHRCEPRLRRDPGHEGRSPSASATRRPG